MQISKWSFNPGLVPTLASLLLLPLLLSLGYWQLGRAAEKQALFDEYVGRAGLAPVDWNREPATLAQAGDILWRRTIVQGHYADDKIFLLDNQVLNGTAGYLVFSPLMIEGTRLSVLVNRGWISAGDYRDRPPDVTRPMGLLTLTGIVTPYPMAPGIQLGEDAPNPQQLSAGIIRMQLINAGVLQDLLAYPLSPYLIRLDATAPTGFIRQWTEPGSGAERHRGYAFQWFACAAALVVIYISVNLRPPTDERGPYGQS